MATRKKGIFCLEGDWRGVRDKTSVEPMLRLLETMGNYRVPYFHHDVGTQEEFRFYLSLLQNPSSAGFLHPKAAVEGRSTSRRQRSQGGRGRRRRGAGVARIHGAFLPVMRASTRDETWRISFTSRSSSRLFSIHSL